MIRVMTFFKRFRKSAIGFRPARFAVSFVFFACLTAQGACARSRVTEMETGEEGDVKWVRVENEQLRLDFSPKGHDILEEVVLLSRERNLAGFLGEETFFGKTC